MIDLIRDDVLRMKDERTPWGKWEKGKMVQPTAYYISKIHAPEER